MTGKKLMGKKRLEQQQFDHQDRSARGKAPLSRGRSGDVPCTTFLFIDDPLHLQTDAIVFLFIFILNSSLRSKAECFRQPLIRSNPEFAANPFEIIRTHARNTLASHQP
jgi:hypothetical protein